MEKREICLNVAEKPSVAKGVTQILSKGQFRTTTGLSKYNPIYEFNMDINGRPCNMKFTSVLGHVKGIKYPEGLGNWQETPLDALYTTPVLEYVLPSSELIAKNLKSQSNKI